MAKTVITTPSAPSAIGPYAQANLAGGILYISGQLPVDPASGRLEEGIGRATHQVMRNLQAVLSAAGCSFGDVVKATIYLKNMDDFAEMNAIYATYLVPGAFPARETIQVSCLPKNAEIEISMIAHKPL